MHLHPVDAGETTVTGSVNDWLGSPDLAAKGGSVRRSEAPAEIED